MDASFHPGFSHLPLVFRQPAVGSKRTSLNHKIDKIQTYYVDMESSVDSGAYHLLLALLYEELNKDEEAIARIEKTVKDSRERSLNGLAELVRILQKHGRNREAAVVQQKLDNLLKDGSERTIWLVACAKAEQAIVLLMETGFITDENYDLMSQLHQESHETFTSIVEQTEDPVYSKYEMNIFYFHHAHTDLRHCGAKQNTSVENDFVIEVATKFAVLADYFLDAINDRAWPLADRVEKRFLVHYAGRCVCYIGNISSKYCGTDKQQRRICELLRGLDCLEHLSREGPNAIFEFAIKINPDDPQNHARYAGSLNAQGEIEKAFSHILESARCAEKRGHHHLYGCFTCMRILISVKAKLDPSRRSELFRRQKLTDSHLSAMMEENFKILREADYDNGAACIALGRYYLMESGFQAGFRPPPMKDPLMAKTAARMFDDAIECDVGSRLQEALSWSGTCYRYMRVYPKAIESLKGAIEKERQDSSYGLLATILMECFGDHGCSSDEIAVWLVECCRKFEPNTLEKTFQNLQRKRSFNFSKKLDTAIEYFKQRMNSDALRVLMPYLGEQQRDVSRWLNSVGLAATNSVDEAKLLSLSKRRLRATEDVTVKAPGKQFDFFVSYSLLDEEVVEHMLACRLEREHSLKGCLLPRDVQSGGDVIPATVEFINKSDKLLLFVSEGFINRVWPQFQKDPLKNLLEELARNKKVVVLLCGQQSTQLPVSLQGLPTLDLNNVVTRFERIMLLCQVILKKNADDELASGLAKLNLAGSDADNE